MEENHHDALRTDPATNRRVPPRRKLCSVLVLLSGAAPSVWGAAGEVGGGDPSYANLHGETLLDNPRVLVQKSVVQPGQSTGRRGHPAGQLRRLDADDRHQRRASVGQHRQAAHRIDMGHAENI